MMRILQIMAGGEYGGAETAFTDICIALHEKNPALEVITRSNDLRVSKLRAANIKVHTLPFGGFLDLYTSYKIKKIIKNFKPDIVQSWMSRAASKIPLSKHMNYIHIARLGGYYKLKYYKTVDYFIANTLDIQRYLIDQNIPADKTKHIYNFAEEEKAKIPLNRSEFDTPETAPLLLALGRLHHVKGFDTLLKAMINIPDAYLWIAGEGPQRAELLSLCQTLNLTDRVRFLGWRDDRAALFNAADICVFPSRSEPFGNIAIQAWAHKTPLVTTNSEGPQEYVEDGVNALKVAMNDSDALAQAILKMIHSPDLARRLVKNGYQKYKAQFTKKACVDAYIDCYKTFTKPKCTYKTK